MFDIRKKRLARTQARKLVTEIAQRHPGGIRFSRHAFDQMRQRDLIVNDVLNVIKSPDARILDEAEFEKGSYRYRLQTRNIMVVLAFDTDQSLVVVTAWRK